MKRDAGDIKTTFFNNMFQPSKGHLKFRSNTYYHYFQMLGIYYTNIDHRNAAVCNKPF